MHRKTTLMQLQSRLNKVANPLKSPEVPWMCEIVV